MLSPRSAFSVYVRANGRILTQYANGATVPNAASRFQEFVAGKMISSPDANEAVVTERFARTFGYENLADAVGQTLEFLAPPNESTNAKKNAEDKSRTNFFGIPLGDEAPGDNSAALVGQTFRIAGVLKTEIKEGPNRVAYEG